MKTKTTPKFKPYSLNCESGYVAEVDKGCFVGQDGESGETCLVDDLCDGYICPKPEAEELAREFRENANIPHPHEGYPILHKVRREVHILGQSKVEV